MADLREQGVPEEVIATLPEMEVLVTEVEPDNWDSLMVFLSLTHQWRKIIPPMGGKVMWEGLRYDAVEVVIRMLGHADKAKDIFADILVMEGEALRLLNKG